MSVAAATASSPQTPETAATAELPMPIRKLVAQHMTVVTSFKAEAGLAGWVLASEGRQVVAYTTSDGQHLIVGSLIDENGRNLTSVYASTYERRPDLTSSYRQLDSARYVTDGPVTSTHVIYVFFDPNCIFCNFAWKALRPYIQAGLQVRWIPVGFLKPTSSQRAVAILEAKEPTRALEINETGFVASAEEGGITSLSVAKPGTLSALTANRALMDAFGGHGTPTFVWKDSRGAIRTKSGMPPLSELATISGLPEQPQTDRSLDRFR
ncbi:thiol:disulfide interchange protein DsbG [Paraburkholderia ginsengiterrae]|uniref:thiol:disulfide interchange protein DsbG n=1 Tax=Paraburkholderia ginsengiterrae TaxID=1462993 RepID=UPI0013F4E599|nr:thiol:disulfide interchange protein DsbG [Paraburkholderia ginsengiterrae]